MEKDSNITWKPWKEEENFEHLPDSRFADKGLKKDKSKKKKKTFFDREDEEENKRSNTTNEERILRNEDRIPSSPPSSEPRIPTDDSHSGQKEKHQSTFLLNERFEADRYDFGAIGGNKVHLLVDDDNIDEKESLADSHGIVELNVGGKLFSTTMMTLRKDPDSMLYAMFSGVYKSKKDKNGAYFIDRDGTYFRYILNYLRDGAVDLMNEESKLRQLLREAQYYQIMGLISDIEEVLQIKNKTKDLDKKGQYAVAYLGGYGKSAQIYTKDTGGGFSETCVTLNKLAAEGYSIEGVASGANGHYYAVLRTKSDTDNKSLFSGDKK
eukprot:TRINITY_DN1447_c0_g1_i1.p1 TRINITY_DN1447_c0_g1~~TRINITY_DN1447_c0_g1_i1.p1  ORF type:complete len:324 (-),score=92.17 TRINITY_DN1447_c0_g1_i1:40-1011(-)